MTESLADWIDRAVAIDRRRSSCHRYAAADRHLAAFPVTEIHAELEQGLLRAARDILKDGRYAPLFRQPPRGHRAAGPHRPIIMACNNQLARLARAGIGHNRPPEDR